MKLMTFASFKGGAGKSTALMATAGSLSANGYRVALFEADENRPLARWYKNATELGTWDQRCEVFPAQHLEYFEASYERAETDGFDFGLMDTHGGGSDLNNTILVNSDLIVIPTALTAPEIATAQETYNYIVKLFEQDERDELPVGILVQRMPTRDLSSSERANLRILDCLPFFETKMYLRNAFADIEATGMLPLFYLALKANPAKRIAAYHIKTAMNEAESLALDLLETMAEMA